MVATDHPLLLRKVCRSHDALIMCVTDNGQQQYTGKLQRVYSRRFEGPQKYDLGVLQFVGAPGSWGNITLKDGELALVFICYLPHSQRYYQHHWHGHFTLFEINRQLHAIANWPLLQNGYSSWGPEYLRRSAFIPDLTKPWQVAMPFDLLETHLIEELSSQF